MARVRSIVVRSYEAYNARDFDAYRELLDDDVEFVLAGVTVRGRVAVTDFVAVTARARPSLRIAPQRFLAETDNTLVAEIRMIDTIGVGSVEEASTVETEACCVYRVTGDRLKEVRVYLDPGGEEEEVGRMAVAAEQSALRRVAELVAQQAPSEQVFTLVTDELSHLLDVNLVWTARFEADGSATVLATRGRAADRMPPGTNMPLLAGGVFDQVLRTGRPARLDDYAQIHGLNDPALVEQLREDGLRCGAGGPIVVEGRIWGAMLAASPTAETLPPGIEDRIAQFAELVSTAISNVESRARVERLAAEQAALRRVAELVASQPPPEQVFALVTEAFSLLVGAEMVRTVRFEPDGTVMVLAAQGMPSLLPAGTNWPVPAGGVLDEVLRTGHQGRVDDFTQVTGPLAVALRDEGIRSAAGGPIVVDGRTWGAIGVLSQRALPAGTEDRAAEFAELVSTAISNVESRAKVERLAAEQAALRRVAEFVAAQPPPEHVFALVTQELSRLLGVDMVRTVRFEADGSATVVASSGMADDPIPPGTNAPIPSGSVIEKVSRTSRPARVDDYAKVGGPIGARLGERGAGSAVGGPIVVDGRLWGAMVACKTAEALPSDTEERVAQFAELVSTAISNVESRSKVERLATEQAALRRVATLVAEGATPNRVFDGVRDEVEQMFGTPNTILMRFDSDGMATLLSTPGDYGGRVGTQWSLEGNDTAVTRVYRTGRAARADYTRGAVGQAAEAARRGGTVFPVAVPVVVGGALWGAVSVGSPGPQPPPPDLEGRLAKFTELLATAVANAESRASLAASEARARELASEQAALRRVATLVAQGASPDELFSAVTKEVGVLLDVDAASILRYETDSTVTVVTGWSEGAIQLPIGARLPLEGENLAAEVLRTGRPQRKDEYGDARGRIASTVRELGLTAAVASPIVVEGAIWGVIGVLSRMPRSLAADTEARLTEFSRVAGMAVANAKSRSDLAQSRARIVRAGDEARRRFERDLHDGAQQRLVSLEFALRAAEATLPAQLDDVRRVLSGLEVGLSDVLDDLRELSRGLHPVALSEGGLTPALRALARRSAVPVDLRLELDAERFEEPVEVAAYYVAAEALTNTAKHAHASQVELRASRRGAWLELSVKDDGQGGAVASDGSGLTGLVDRVEAIGGTIQIDSPPQAGTDVRVKLPAAPTLTTR